MDKNPYDITFGFSTTTKWISGVIRNQTGDERGPSPVSHAWISYSNMALSSRDVLEAEWYGLRPTCWPIWSKKNIVMIELEPIGNILDLSFFNDKIGLPYNWLSAFFLGKFKWVARWLKLNLKSPKEYFCSESPTRFLQENGYKNVRSQDPEKTSPLLLLKCLLSDAKEMRIKRAKPFIVERFCEYPVCREALNAGFMII